MRIGIIDYGVGNLASIKNALERLGVESIISSDNATLQKSDALILPGDGAAKKGMENIFQLNLSGLIIDELEKEKPFLGICLGMQLLLQTSQEGDTDCLGIIKGSVDRLNIDLKLPQIGWNSVEIKNKKSTIMKDIPNNSFFYFINSYICKPINKTIISGTTQYGEEFCSVFEINNVFGVQFHPEKSGDVGIQVLRNFIVVADSKRIRGKQSRSNGIATSVLTIPPRNDEGRTI